MSEALRVMRTKITFNLPKMASELLELRETGILQYGKVRETTRELSEALGLDSNTSLSMVRSEIEFQALSKVSL